MNEAHFNFNTKNRDIKFRGKRTDNGEWVYL